MAMQMIRCPRCGTEIPSGSLFCTKCGTRISAVSHVSRFNPSHLRKAAIPVGALAVVTVLALAIFSGEQNPCEGVVCSNRCWGTTLWKMKCVEGECTQDYLLERDSEECGFIPPPPETSAPQTDSDADGVFDSSDDCYNPGCTIVSVRGCPLDSDGDGLSDCYDDCPYEKGERTNKGCPVTGIISIQITMVNYDAPRDDNDNPNGEWVKIANTGNRDVDMSGWRLYDNAYKWGTARDHVFVFPSGFILRAGQSVTVYTGKGINTGSQLYFGRSPGEYAAIWNNDGDCAYLVDDEGNLIDMYCW